MPSNAFAIEKYIKTAKASTIVVIIGDTATAGSNLNFLAIKGKEEPATIAIEIVQIRVSDTAPATKGLMLCKSHSLKKFASA